MRRLLRSKLDHATVVAYIALFMALSGGAIAATSFVGSGGKILGCVSKSGQLTVLKGGKHCKPGQTAISWNQKGVQGAQGAQGAQGVQGPPGTQGDIDHANTADSATTAASAGNADKLDNKDSNEFAIAGSEDWHAATLSDTTTAVAPNDPPHSYCYWENFGDVYAPAGYFRDPSGVVHLRGVVRAQDGNAHLCADGNSFNSLILTLPPGYRPGFAYALTTTSNNAPGRLNVRTGGDLAIQNSYPTFVNAKGFVSLDGLSFRCAPSGQDGCP
jgi:hypothetical protein